MVGEIQGVHKNLDVGFAFHLTGFNVSHRQGALYPAIRATHSGNSTHILSFLLVGIEPSALSADATSFSFGLVQGFRHALHGPLVQRRGAHLLSTRPCPLLDQPIVSSSQNLGS